MVKSLKVIVVLPAYNAAKTLKQTFVEIPFDIVDEIVLVDDASTDETTEIAKILGIKNIILHANNKGYGANQKSCYNMALQLGADVIVMLHPDYQYTPKLLTSMIWIIANDVYPVVLGSRILGKGAIKGGMPKYKYVANRILTFVENILIGEKLSEYHTGYRAYARRVLESIDYNNNSDDFIFDNEFLTQILLSGFEVAEITCPTKYFKEASSINFSRSLRYGFGVVLVSFKCFLQRIRLANFKMYRETSKILMNPEISLTQKTPQSKV